MNKKYFESIERFCKVTNRSINLTTIRPQRRCMSITGEVIEKNGESQIPEDTLKRMISGTTQKYKRTTSQIIHQIQTGKRKGTIKYQTLGWKQAKEIKLWCDENKINCNIVEDLNIMRNKLHSIDTWWDIDGTLYDDGTRDYGNEYIDFRIIKQHVVYVQIVK